MNLQAVASWLLLVLLVKRVTASYPFYHITSNLTSVIQFNSSVANGGLFGYSGAYEKKSQSLFIGAPMASPDGMIFKCFLNSSNNCETVPVNTKITNKDDHHSLLGVNIQSKDAHVMTCAPRALIQDSGVYLIIGKCFYMETSDLVMQPMNEISLKEKKERIDKSLGKEHLMDTLGWSIDLNSNHILLGGPGMNAGQAVEYTEWDATPTYVSDKSNKINFNFGYSIASGNFLGKESMHAISSTYGDMGAGKIYVSDKNKFILIEAEKNETGTLFGASLCSVKLEADKIIANRVISATVALFVGAPTYFDSRDSKSYDRGAVFIYTTKDPNKMTRRLTIYGQKDGGYFGSAILNLGDVDGDKIEDVAISAPYEDGGRGAVYIYSGANLKNEITKEIQRIQPDGYKAFGISLFRVSDYDENGCNELGIGAPGSLVEGQDRVMVVRCMASITVNLNKNSKKYHIYNRTDYTFFDYETCFNVTFGEKPKIISTKIVVTIELEHSDAIFEGNKTKTSLPVELNKIKKTYCVKSKVLTPYHGNYNEILKFKTTLGPDKDPAQQENFDPTYVILSGRSVLENTEYISAANCTNETSDCKPNLQLNVTFSMQSQNELVNGSAETTTVRIDLWNTGEVAYVCCVRVRVSGAQVASSGMCTCDTSLNCVALTCRPRHRLAKNEHWIFEDIKLDTSKATNLVKVTQIDSYIYNTCTDENPEKNYTLSRKMTIDYNGFIIRGKTDLGNIVNIYKSEIESTGKYIEHEYRIINNGFTNWVGLKCLLTLQNVSYVNYLEPKLFKQHLLSASQTDQETEVTCEQGSDENLGINCTLGNLMKNDDITIKIPIKITSEIINKLKTQVTLTTDLKLILDDTHNISESITTVLQYVEINTPWWIIMVAVIFAALVLALLIYILHETGLLKRANKEKLENLKKEVKRQSMKRTTTLRENSHLGDSDERNLIAIEEISEQNIRDAETEVPTVADVHQR